MHSDKKDYSCPTCHWTIQIGIPHECSFMLCQKCAGTGMGGWRHRDVCDRCKGDGKWHDGPDEENPEGVLVGSPSN